MAIPTLTPYRQRRYRQADRILNRRVEHECRYLQKRYKQLEFVFDKRFVVENLLQ